MVHPAVYAAIVVGGVVIVGLRLYEEYLENKSYEQFQRNRTRYEREYNRFHRQMNDFDFDDDRNHGEEETRVKEEQDPYTVRKRKPYDNSGGNSATSSIYELKKSINEDPDQYELSELENSIAERKRRLMAEQAFLDQEEENLRNRKNALMRIYDAAGGDDDVTSSNALDRTKFNSSSMESSEMEDEASLKHRMSRFNPFVDQEEGQVEEEEENGASSESTEIMYVEAEQDLSISDHDRLNTKATTNELGNSTELCYPTPHTTTTPNNTNSEATSSVISSPQIMSVSSTHGSESEESWDAVSEAEWNQTSADESDNDQHTTSSRRPRRDITRPSSDEEEDLVRF